MRTNGAKVIVTLLLVLATPLVGQAWERGTVERFVTLPAGEAHPEGICADRQDNVYVAVEVKRPDTSAGTQIQEEKS